MMYSKVVFIGENTSYHTYGKQYDIDEFCSFDNAIFVTTNMYDNSIFVTTDMYTNSFRFFDKTNFITIGEYRELVINKILNI